MKCKTDLDVSPSAISIFGRVKHRHGNAPGHSKQGAVTSILIWTLSHTSMERRREGGSPTLKMTSLLMSLVASFIDEKEGKG